MGTLWERECWTNWESSTEKCTLPYIKLDSGNLLYDAGSSNQVFCDNLEGWSGGSGGGREVQGGGGKCMPMADSCWYMAETNTIL